MAYYVIRRHQTKVGCDQHKKITPKYILLGYDSTASKRNLEENKSITQVAENIHMDCSQDREW